MTTAARTAAPAPPERQLHLISGTLVLVVTIASFESTAVATFAAAALADIGRRGLHPYLFSLFALAEVVALVLGGWLCTRSGPARAFLIGVAVHAAGLLLCGIAPAAGWLLAGRVVQGAGTGLVKVSVYVLIGHLYGAEERGRMLGRLAMAWAIPALLGPLVAAAVIESLSWRWVLLPVFVVELVLLAPVWSLLNGTIRWDAEPSRLPRLRTRLVPAGLVATGLLAVMSAGELGPGLAWPVVGAALAVIMVGARPLGPHG
jgi:MFS family permease